MAKLVMVVLAALALVAHARPCPPNAYFLYSPVHSASMCACAREYVCGGSSCTMGSDSNLPLSFNAKSDGFSPDCMDCGCVRKLQGDAAASETAEARLQRVREALRGTYREVPTTDGGVMRDFLDPLFEASCKVHPDVPVPRPKALRYMNWLHFPK